MPNMVIAVDVVNAASIDGAILKMQRCANCMIVTHTEKLHTDFKTARFQYPQWIARIFVLPNNANFNIIIITPATELTITKENNPPPISKHPVIIATIIILWIKSHDLSCTNFS